MNRKGFILFGWGNTYIKDHGPALLKHCSHCDNNVKFHTVRERTWFSLFFIPVVPYDSTKYLICPVCSTGYELTNKGYQQAKELSNCFNTVEEYDEKYEEFKESDQKLLK